jgi:colicin import membrane protein
LRVEPEPQVQSLEGERAEAGERLRVALADAEKRLEQARREFREASGALSVAEKRAEAAKAELQEASRRLERAEERAALTAEDETSARQKAEQAAAARESAEAERDASLRALRAVE